MPTRTYAIVGVQVLLDVANLLLEHCLRHWQILAGAAHLQLMPVALGFAAAFSDTCTSTRADLLVR